MKLLFVSFALLALGQLRAEQLFLYVTTDCGELIRYEHRVDGAVQADYYSYNLPVGDAAIYLESDGAGTTSLTALPEQYLLCAESALDASIVDRLNRGETQLMIITDDPDGGFLQRPVLMATLVTVVEGRTSYTSPFASFAYDLEETVIGENLDIANEGGTVYFSGRSGNDCASPYLFYEQHPTAAYSRIDYQLYPGIGLLERQLTAATDNSQDDLIVAREINGLPVTQYLAEHCRQEMAEPVYTEQQLTFRPVYQLPEEPVTTLPEPTAPASSAPATLHTVSRGETLYGISRKYAVTVDQLRQANGLTDNTITEGQQLRIGASGATPDEVVTEYATEEYAAEQYPAPAIVVPPTEPIVRVPPPADDNEYATVGTPAPVTTTQPVSMHTVLAGETLASIARKYGYTKERFMAFNNIDGQSVALVGQRLLTSDCSCPGEFVEVPAPYVSAPVVVPEPTPSPVPPAAAPPAYGSELAQHDFTHVVREGETLYAIARQYGLSVQELRQRNGLPASDVIVPFQKLRVN